MLKSINSLFKVTERTAHCYLDQEYFFQDPRCLLR